MFLKLESGAINVWEDLKNQTEKDREFWGAATSLAATGLKKVKEAEEWNEQNKISKCDYKLYKSKVGKGTIIDYYFYKPYEKRFKHNYWIMPSGLPTQPQLKRKAALEKENISFENYTLDDQGKFIYRLSDFHKASIILMGKKHLNLKATYFTNGKSGLWVSLPRKKKLSQTEK